MKTIARFLALLALCTTLQAQAQIINMNPDPLGEPWWSGGAVAPPPGTLSDAIEFFPTPASLALPLPSSAYNHNHVWFPYIYWQYGQSCIQVAEIFYTFTYEINRKFNRIPGNGGEDKTNLYNALYTYNFLNRGFDTTYTDFQSGFNIIKQNGCPSWDIYDDPALYHPSTRYKYWMTGYDNYYSGMHNTISDIYTFNFATSASSLNNLKHWIAYHGNGEETGGLAVIGVKTAVWNPNGVVPSGSPYHAGEKFIASFGSQSGHALTIVGYNDDIWIQDINGDGQYTNDIDVNGDGVFNIHDFEKGAFLVANSWGQGWNPPSGGYILIPYKHFYPGNPGFVISYAYTCDVFPESNEIPEPSLSFKASIEHPARNKISMRVGYAPLASNSEPTSITNYTSFNLQGGANDMRGVYPGPIENGLNFGYHYGDADFGKLFFRVIENNDPGNTSNGTINYFSLIDHRWDEEFELFCDQTNVNIINNDTTTLAIEYHLLPHEQPVTSDLDLTSNRVSRFITTVENPARLIVHNNVKIDMYNSELHILSGSSLTIGNGASFHAKNGDCKIVIDGSISVGENVSFLADEGATIELILNNLDIEVWFSNNTFSNCIITSFAQNLNITNSELNESMVSSYSSDVSVHGSTFNNSTLYLENQTKNQELSVSVTGSNFNTHTDPVAIDILNYGNYLIAENTINGFHEGLKMNYCGNGVAGNQSIYGNHIFNSKGLYSSAIILYNTTGTLEMNDLHDNFYGLRLMNSCNIALYGNGSAQNQDQTQRIKDNTSYEIYCSRHSFPWYFRHNVIIDEDNIPYPFDPLLYWAYPEGSRVDQKDIRYNCWGNNFSAIDDLFPSAYFIYDPVWCPGFSGAMVDPIEDLYNMGTEQFESGNYSTSKSTFQLLIQQYPKSDYAQAAMKELVRLEEYVTSDYASLKNYFLTNDSIVADTILIAIAEILANKCDIKLENWQQAIDWLENRIINPTCLEDSVFGIIDLGYVYFLMENQNLKSAYTGNLKQFIPETKAEFFEHRDYLLSLLPGDLKHNNLHNNPASSYGSLLHNVPNPFNENTQIWYRVETKSSVAISITDLTGKEIRKIEIGVKEKGTYKIDFSSSNISAGAYFYTLILNGRRCDTKKMIIMR